MTVRHLLRAAAARPDATPVVAAARKYIADKGYKTVAELVEQSRSEPVIIQPENRLASAVAAYDAARPAEPREGGG